jgi:hypothetical protein
MGCWYVYLSEFRGDSVSSSATDVELYEGLIP